MKRLKREYKEFRTETSKKRTGSIKDKREIVTTLMGYRPPGKERRDDEDLVW